jgi:sRNA-binding carbon storage regulator CsrA
MTDLELIIKSIETAINDFEKNLPAVEKDIASKVTALIAELDIRQGHIKPTISNLRQLKVIRKEINKIFQSGKYQQSVKELQSSLSLIDAANDKYFSTMVSEYSAPSVLQEVKSVTLSEIQESLLYSGINANIVDGMADIIKNNIFGGSTFYELNNSLKDFILSSDDIPSRLASWSKQIVVDTIHQYSATYQQIVTDDLGLEWFEYVGGTVKDSREWCVAMVKKQFIHKSELPEIIKGYVDGKKVEIYPKTGLPQGMIGGTNPNNVQVLRGGYNCQHLMPSVSKERVPVNIRKKFEK